MAHEVLCYVSVQVRYLLDKYVHLCEGRDTVCCHQLISNVLCHFGDDLVKLDISGCASLLCFKDHLPSCIRIEKVEDDEEAMITKMTDTLMAECKALPKLGYKVGKFTQSEAIKSTSCTLLTLVYSLASCGKTSRVSLTLAQAIQSHITKSFNQTTLGLAIMLHHRFGSKELVSLLHQHGLTATYDEVLRFRTSAAGCSTQTLCSRRTCSCQTAGVSCTTYCKCMAQDDCNNPHTVQDDTEDSTDDDEEREDVYVVQLTC